MIRCLKSSLIVFAKEEEFIFLFYNYAAKIAEYFIIRKLD